ncbi:MAG: hypothetical protein NT030_05525, partial [Candidatus Saganbacteria bacterium]|nr:hypothetical protein [Candidatus Saganbacteria bacterium]
MAEFKTNNIARNNNTNPTNRVMDFVIRKSGFANRSLVADKLNAGSFNPQIEAHREALWRHGIGIASHPVEREIKATDIRRCITPENLLGLQNDLKIQLGFESMISELQSVGRIKRAVHKTTNVIFGIEYSLEVAARLSGSEPSGDYLGDQGITRKLTRELSAARGYVLPVLGNQDGFIKPKTLFFLAMLTGGLTLAHIVKTHEPALFFAGGLLSATALIGLITRNPKAIYRVQSALPSVLLTASAMFTRFYLMDRFNVWGGSAVTLGIILGSFMIHGLYRKHKEFKRHEALDSIRPEQIARMSEVRNFLEVFYRIKWDAKKGQPWSIEDIKHEIEIQMPEKQEPEHIKENESIKRMILNYLDKTGPKKVEK